MLARRRRQAVTISTVLAGSALGFVRMAQGAHFLSDIIFAGVFMAILVAFLHACLTSSIWGRHKIAKALAELERELLRNTRGRQSR
jgi:hypothetical protein